MTDQQQRAADRLQKALDACHKAGLRGGVFDSSFYVWPVDSNPNPYDSPRFFEAIREAGGEWVVTAMSLDGGAGS